MAHALAQVRLQRNTLLPEDVVINTFHFDTGDANATVGTVNAQNIADRLEIFYNTAPAPSPGALQGHMGAGMAATGHQIRVYDMSMPEPRPPILVEAAAITPGGGLPLPHEVALVLSFRAALEAGTNPARRRGRIYFGPLSTSAVASQAGGDARPSAELMTCLANAGARLIADTGPDWSVFSETTFLTGGGDHLIPVVTCHVDNAFDTQRRRGAISTARTVRP